jgi:hypothetical protein
MRGKWVIVNNDRYNLAYFKNNYVYFLRQKTAKNFFLSEHNLKKFVKEARTSATENKQPMALFLQGSGDR